jgi:hypothetical protein
MAEVRTEMSDRRVERFPWWVFGVGGVVWLVIVAIRVIALSGPQLHVLVFDVLLGALLLAAGFVLWYLDLAEIREAVS